MAVMQEQEYNRPFDLKVWKKIFPFLRPYRVNLWVVILFNIIMALVDKRVKSEHIHTYKTSELIVESGKPLAWSLDGEFGGDHQSVVIESWHRALEIRVPDETE